MPCRLEDLDILAPILLEDPFDGQKTHKKMPSLAEESSFYHVNNDSRWDLTLFNIGCGSSRPKDCKEGLKGRTGGYTKPWENCFCSQTYNFALQCVFEKLSHV